MSDDATNDDAAVPVALWRLSRHDMTLQPDSDVVAHEEPLEIQINGASVAVVMRTPGDDEALTLGFLLTERIIASAQDVDTLRHCTTVLSPDAEGNVMRVVLHPHVPFDLERLRRHTFASSSCGVCGKATIENACAVAPPLADSLRVHPNRLWQAVAALTAQQRAFSTTGGLHAAGLFLANGDAVCVFEDVGRHNAVDKCVGFLARHPPAQPAALLMVSGRISLELVQKAAAARIPVLAGISAPTSLAVRMAHALGITLCGFVRERGCNIYTHRERFSDDASL